MIKTYDLFLPWNQDQQSAVFTQVKAESLFRLNPHWIINSFDISGQSFHIEITDHESEEPFSLNGRFDIGPDSFCVLTSDSSDWESIRFFVQEDSLHAEVCFVTEPAEEVERHVVLWLRSIKEYLRLYVTNSLYTRCFRLIMNRVVLPMTPSQRKISLMLTRITMLELLAILLILVGWFFFFR